jgi:hypothetical protein
VSAGPSISRRIAPVALCVFSLFLAAAAIFAWRAKSIDLPLLGKSSPELSNPLLTSPSSDIPREAKNFGLGFYPPSATEIPISIGGGYCVGAKAKTITRVQRVEVEETGRAVKLRPFYVEPDGPGGVCAGVGYTVYGTAHLSEPIGDRVVIDGRGRRTRVSRSSEAIGSRQAPCRAARPCILMGRKSRGFGS